MNTLLAMTENYLNYCKTQKRLANKTLKAYHTDLNQFASFSTTILPILYP